LELLALMLLLAGGGQAAAEVHVRGERNGVHVEARDVPLREVLEALKEKYNLSYRSSDPLERRKSGDYSGPLYRVVARVLDGYDFAITVRSPVVSVLILGEGGGAGSPVERMPARTAVVAGPAPVMTAAEANRYERDRSR
jgi:hypothetical protein